MRSCGLENFLNLAVKCSLLGLHRTVLLLPCEFLSAAGCGDVGPLCCIKEP